MTDIVPFDMSNEVAETSYPPYDYSQLTAETLSQVREHEQQIDRSFRRTNDEAVKIGQHLIEVKALLPHGHFTPWYQARYGMSQQTASILMRKARGTYKPLINSGLSDQQQQKQLAAPEVEPTPENPHDARWEKMHSAEHKASRERMYAQFREEGCSDEDIAFMQDHTLKLLALDWQCGLEMQTALLQMRQKYKQMGVSNWKECLVAGSGYPWEDIELLFAAEHPSLAVLDTHIDIISLLCSKPEHEDTGSGLRITRKLDEEMYARLTAEVERAMKEDEESTEEEKLSVYHYALMSYARITPRPESSSTKHAMKEDEEAGHEQPTHSSTHNGG